MNQITKKQHYIWRYYLTPWTINNSNEGRIMCLRDNRIFPVSLINIAHENYFYQVKELSEFEKKMIYEICIKNTSGAQRIANEGWLSFYCAPYDYADSLTFLGSSILGYSEQTEIRNKQEFNDWNIEHIEKLHSLIESKNIEHISALRRNDLSFWKDKVKRDQFSFFLSIQYFRTKNVRDAIVKVFNRFKDQNDSLRDICPENIWIPLSLIFASNVGAHIAQNFSAVLLQTNSDFIVGDQPVINTYSTFDERIPPKDMEFFYPISPYTALLLTKDQFYSDGQIIKINEDATAKYNQLERSVAKEMIFAREKKHLELYLNNEYGNG